MNRPQIKYEDSAICLTCWATPIDKSPKQLNHFLMPTEIPSHKQNKISLMKYNHSELKQKLYLKPSLKTLSRDTYQQKSERLTYQERYHQQNYNPNQKANIANFTNYPKRINYQQFQPLKSCQYKTIPYRPEYSAVKMVYNSPNIKESVELKQTTKFERLEYLKSDQLTKTKKYPLSKRLMHLEQLKQSVCSFSYDEDAKQKQQRLQQSQVLINFFNPNNGKLDEITEYIKSKQLKKSSIIIMNKNHP